MCYTLQLAIDTIIMALQRGAVRYGYSPLKSIAIFQFQWLVSNIMLREPNIEYLTVKWTVYI